jgi:hypothetical protein
VNGHTTGPKPRPWNNREIDAGAQRLVAEARALRLSDMRRRHRTIAVRAAEETVPARGRVWRIDKDQLRRSELDALAAYVQELGGTLKIAASYGDETYVSG